MSEAHCDLFTEFYRRRIAPYLKEIGNEDKAAEDKNAKTA